MYVGTGLADDVYCVDGVDADESEIPVYDAPRYKVW